MANPAPSIREQVITAIEAALITIDGFDVHVQPDFPIETIEVNSLVLLPGDDNALEEGADAGNIEMDIMVVGVVRKRSDGWLRSAETARTLIRTALSADVSLGGIAADMRYSGTEGLVNDLSASAAVGFFAVHYEALFNEADDDPTQHH
jgi:hypothetical protein